MYLKAFLACTADEPGVMLGRSFQPPFTTMKTKTATRACQACAYWNPFESDAGECRRHAPQTVAFEVDEEVKFESMFPVTAGDDWCGDFEKKD